MPGTALRPTHASVLDLLCSQGPDLHLSRNVTTFATMQTVSHASFSFSCYHLWINIDQGDQIYGTFISRIAADLLRKIVLTDVRRSSSAKSEYRTSSHWGATCVSCYSGFYLSSTINLHLCYKVAIMSSCTSVTCSSMLVLKVLR